MTDDWRWMGKSPEIEYGDESPLDTARWGIKTYRVNALAKKDLSLYDDGLVIARTESVSLVQHAIRMGYFLCDTLTVWKGATHTPNVPLPPSYWSRPIEKKDGPAIERLAYDAFEGYQSHYSTDSRLPQQKIPLAYAQWAGNSEKGIVIEMEKCEFPYVHRAVVAFGTFSEPCELTLAGVSDEHKGKGLYKQIVMACMRDGEQRGVKDIEISTQITNLAVQRVWADLGLRPYKHLYTLHWWPT